MHQGLTNSLKYIILASLVFVPIFGFLDTLPIRIWDEARVAVNAYEMYKDGNYIVPHFDGSPEMWNTKPPFLLWTQVFFMKVIGASEIAIRLPSSLAVFFTCLALLLFTQRYLKSFWLGFIVVLGLITSEGYMNFHIARTGDYDAMLILFTTTSCLFFYTFCETKQNKYLYWFFFALTLGLLTKGVAAVLFTPALFLFVLIKWQFKFFLKNKHFYVGLLGFIFIGLGYYFLRESQNPGYIAAVQENELGGRFVASQGNRNLDFWFYYNNFLEYRLPDRYLLVPCGMMIGFFSKNERIQKLTLFIFLLILVLFIVISTSKTKFEWYDGPLYPFLAIVVAFFVYYLFDILSNLPSFAQSLKQNIVPYLFLFLIFIPSIRSAWNKTYAPDEYSWHNDFYEIGRYLKDALRGNVNLNGKYLVYDGYNTQNLFYTNILNDRGVNTGFKNLNDVKEGDVLVICQDIIRQQLRDKFTYTEEWIRPHISICKVTGKQAARP